MLVQKISGLHVQKIRGERMRALLIYGLVEYMCNFIFLAITSLFMDGF